MTKKLLIPTLLAAALAFTGCATTGGGTNQLDPAKTAGAIKVILTPVVRYIEMTDTNSVKDFHDASAALGVLLMNNAYTVDALNLALADLLRNQQDPVVQLGISTAVGVYSIYLADVVSQGFNQTTYMKPILQAIKDSIDAGVKARAKRLKAARVTASSRSAVVARTDTTNSSGAVVTTTVTVTTNTTPAPPSTPTSFLADVGTWLSHWDPALEGVFENDNGLLWVSVDSVTGGSQTLVNEIGLAVELSKKSHLVSLEALTRNGGTAGVVVSGQGGVSVNWNPHDMRLSLYLDGGWYFEDQFTDKVKDDALFGECGLRAFKGLGANTFVTLGMGFQFPHDRRVFSGGAGIRF